MGTRGRFFMLKVCNFISAQVTHAEIAFIYTFFRNLYFRKMENAFLPRAENAFSPKGINGISDQLGRNFFADRSAKQFLPAGNNISGKISWLYALFFRKYCFREWLPDNILIFSKKMAFLKNNWLSRPYFWLVTLIFVGLDYRNFCIVLRIYKYI